MHFRLNDKHGQKISGSLRRAKRTIEKEKLYKLILDEIKNTKQGLEHFNIGNSTGVLNGSKRLYTHL